MIELTRIIALEQRISQERVEDRARPILARRGMQGRARLRIYTDNLAQRYVRVARNAHH